MLVFKNERSEQMPDHKSLPDSDLLQLLQASDHSAYNEIYHRYFYLLYTHAYKKLQDEEQAKDVIQEVFASLWFKRETSMPNTNLAGYLYSAVRYKIFDLFRRQEVKTKYIDSIENYLATQSHEPTDHLIRERQLQAYIEKEIEALPPRMKKIFLLSRRENLSNKEIAEQMDISTDNVSKQVNNALRILKTKLSLLVYIYFLFRF